MKSKFSRKFSFFYAVFYSLFLLLSTLVYTLSPHFEEIPYVYAAAVPECSIDFGANINTFLGEDFSFGITLDNSGGDPGFSPFIEVVLPPEVDLGSATFNVGGLNISPTSPTPVVVTDNDGGDPLLGEVTSPFTGNTFTLPVENTFAAFRLPVGSFVPGQTTIGININATLDNNVVPGIALNDLVQARCGFAFGEDPLNNPSVDPPLASAFETGTVTPTVIIVSKSQFGAPEGERATGENFPYNYSIDADIANTANFTNLTFTENIPNNFTLQSVDTADDDGNGFTITFSPSNGAPDIVSAAVPFNVGVVPAGGTLEVTMNEINGTPAGSDAGFTLTGFIPEFDSGSGTVLNEDTGLPDSVSNTVTGGGTFSGALLQDTTDPVVVSAESLVAQKSVAIVNETGPVGFSPGDTVRYTINFQVSDFFSFNNIVIEDIAPDGVLVNTGSALLSITEDGTTTNGITFDPVIITNETNAVVGPQPYDFSGPECLGCTLAITPDTVDDDDGNIPPDDGDTHLAFDISQAMIDAGLNAELVGGQIGPTAIGEPTTGRLTFEGVIQEDFINAQVFDRSVDSFDVLTNTVDISGEVTSGAVPNNFVSDGSSASFTIVPSTFSKTVAAFNDSATGVDAVPFGIAEPLEISPGDSITYALEINIPTGDLEDLVITDFLPIPFFDVDEINTTFNAGSLGTPFTPTDGDPGSIPPPGDIAYGSNTNGFPGPLPTPTITVDSADNSFQIEFANNQVFEETPSDGINIELLFTITASDEPFGDGLSLVNFATFGVDNSNQVQVNQGSEIIDIETSVPEMKIYKGVVATDANAPTFSPTTVGPIHFESPGSTPSFLGNINSEGLEDVPVESDVINVDAGDTVTYALIIENQGSAESFHPTVTDTLITGFEAPLNQGALNLQVFDGNGNNRAADTVGGLFGFTPVGGTSDGIGDTQLTLTGSFLTFFDDDAGGSALTGTGLANDGANVLVVTYDVIVDQGVEPLEEASNEGQLTFFRASNNGPNFVSDQTLFTESGSAFVFDAELQKLVEEAPVGSGGQISTPVPDVTIGEVVRYRIPITLPEGTTPNLVLNDNIPTGMGFFIDNGAFLDPSATCTGTPFNGSLPEITVTPGGAGVAGNGTDLQVSFNDDVVVINDNDITNNTFCVVYDTVVLDVASNDGLPQNSTFLSNSANISYGNFDLTQGPVATTVNVHEPRLRVTKNIDESSGDAGDTVIYSIEIDHHPQSSLTAFDLELDDEVDSKFAVNQNFLLDGLDNDGDGVDDNVEEGLGLFFSGDPTGGTFTWNFGTTGSGNALFNELSTGSSFTVEYEVTVQNDVNPTEDIPNDADVDYDNIPGTPNAPLFERTASRGDSEDFSIDNIIVDKFVASTSEAHTDASQLTGLEDLAIGEEVTYNISVIIPESELTNLSVEDEVPDIFRIESGALIVDEIGGVVPVVTIDDNNNGDGINDTITFDIANIANPSPNGTGALIFEVVATVLNEPANNDANIKTNTVRVDFTENNNAPFTDTANVEIVEPQLVLTKGINNNSADAGDVRLYTINIDHDAGSTHSDAFDLVFHDTVPEDLTVVGDFNTDGIDNDGDGLIDGADGDELAGGLAPFFDGNATFTLNSTTTNNPDFDQLAISDDITFQFNVQINNDVFPSQVITNSGLVIWDTLPANNDPDERQDSTVGTVDLNIIELSGNKDAVSANFIETGSGQFVATDFDLAIGEEVIYNIEVNIPEATFSDFTITDTLPNFLQATSGSLIQDSGITINSFQVNITDELNGDGIDDTIEFEFGDITNPPAAGNESMIVEVRAIVIDNPGNTAGAGFTNTAEVDFTEFGGGPLVLTEDIDIVEPNLQFNKVVAPLIGDSGDTFTYTITVNNTGTGPAYDIEITDILPTDKMTVNTAFDADGLDNNGDGVDGDANETAGTFFDGNQTFTWNNTTTGLTEFNVLLPGESFTIDYEVTLLNTVSFGDTIPNNAELNYDSAPGVNVNERDYNETDVENITVPATGAVSKNIRFETTEKAIGQFIPYRIAITLDEGTASPLTVVDDLPAGLAYIPDTLSVTTSSPSVSIANIPANPVQTPLSTAVSDGDTQNLVLNFGNVVNSDTNNATDELLFIAYDVAVLNTSDNNVGGGAKTNSVDVTFGGSGGTILNVAAPGINIIEPVVTIDKTSSYTVGNTVTYQIEVENNALSGSASAFDVIVGDILPPEVVFENNLQSVNGPLPTLDSGSLPNLTFSFDEIDPTFNNANPIIFTYDVSIPFSIPENTNLTNSASLLYTSIEGNIADTIVGNDRSNERTGNTGDPGGVTNDYNDSDPLTLTVTRPNLSTSVKTVTDLNGGDIQPNDILRYTIDIINTGNAAATGIDVTDDVPANVNGFTIVTLPGVGTNNSLGAGNGANNTGIVDFENISLDASGGPNDQRTIEYEVQVNGGIPSQQELINNFVIDPATEGGPGGTGSTINETVSPIITIEKFATPTDFLKLDDIVNYTIVVTNSGAGNSTNNVIVDPIPADVLYSTGSLALNGTPLTEASDGDEGDVNVTNPGAITVDVPLIPPTGSVAITFDAIVNTTDFAKEIENVATVNNDQGFTESGAVTVLTVTGTGQKLLGDGNPEKAVGNIIPYRITVTIPQGTIDPLLVTDRLPLGTAYVPGSTVITTNNDPAISFLGTPENVGENPASASIGFGDNQEIVFNFGETTNSDLDNNTNETIFIDYEVVVLNTNDNNDTAVKLNEIDITFGAAGVVGPIFSPIVEVIEPNVLLEKTTSYGSGDTITYLVELENTPTSSQATAFDVVVEDTLPGDLTFANNVNLINGPAAPTVTTVGQLITFTFDEISANFNNLNPVQFTFDATINPNVLSGTLLTNDAQLEYTSLSGSANTLIPGNVFSQERTGNPADAGGANNDYNDNDDVTIAVTRPDLSTSNKSFTDLDGGDIQPNDVLRFRLEIINTGNLEGNGIRVFDDIPEHVSNFNIVTFPTTGNNISVPAPGGANNTGFLDFENIVLGPAGSPNDTEIIEYEVTIDPGLAPDTTFDNEMVVLPAIEGGPGATDEETIVVKAPVLNITKTANVETLNAGNSAFFTILINNSGNSESTNATITDVLPSSIEYNVGSTQFNEIIQTDTLDGDVANFTQGTDTLQIIIPSIAPGGTFKVNFSAAINSSSTNTATVIDDQGSTDDDSVALITNGQRRQSSGGGGGGGGGGGSFCLSCVSDPIVRENVNQVFEVEEFEKAPDVCKLEYDDFVLKGDACLQLVPDREIVFNDLDLTNSSTPFINTLKNTKIISQGDFIVSGHGNHSTGKQQEKFQTGSWEFQPNRLVTRLEAVKVALVANCIPVEETIPIPENGFRFSDLATNIPESDEANNFAARVFYTAYKHGIVQGDSGVAANPNEKATLAEITTIALRASNAIPQGFGFNSGVWHKKYTQFAYDNKMYTGITSVNPRNLENLDTVYMDRNDFSKVIVRTMAFNPNPQIHGYIERVNMEDQTYNANAQTFTPIPNISSFDQQPDQCKVQRVASCLEYDFDRELILSDVPENSWYSPYVDISLRAKIRGDGDYIVSGHGNHSTGKQQEKFQTGSWEYQPLRAATRLELVKVTLISNCIPIPDQVPVPANGFVFKDVPTNPSQTDELTDFTARVMYTAYKHGIIFGDKDGNVRPYDAASRLETIAVLSRAAQPFDTQFKSGSLPFSDTSDFAWYTRDLAFAVDQGFIGGYGDGTFKGFRSIQRSELAKLVTLYMRENKNNGIKHFGQTVLEFHDLLARD